MEDHALGQVRVDLGGFHQMPGNCFAFAVRVGGQVDLGVFLRQFLEFLDNRLLLVRHAILRREIILHIHRKLRAQQIAHMPHRSPHRVTFAEETSHRLGLGRRFHDHQFAVARFPLSRAFQAESIPRALGPAHAIQFRPANGTYANRHRRAFGIERRLRIGHFSFGLALHAISFHETLHFSE